MCICAFPSMMRLKFLSSNYKNYATFLTLLLVLIVKQLVLVKDKLALLELVSVETLLLQLSLPFIGF